jgi:hypothetical protein
VLLELMMPLENTPSWSLDYTGVLWKHEQLEGESIASGLFVMQRRSFEDCIQNVTFVQRGVGNT